MSDPRTVDEVVAGLKRVGVEPVWKDWDGSFDHIRERTKKLHV